MSLDPEQLAEAIKRNDAVAVRALLRDATEADRAACAKALRRLLADPRFNQVAGIPFGGPDGTELIRGGGLADLISSVAARMAGDRHRAEHTTTAWMRRQWNAGEDNAAFMAASLGLAGGVAAAHIAAERFVPWRQPADSDFDAIAGVLADRRPPWLAEFVRRKLCDQFDLGLDSWTLARRLVRLRAIDRPGVPEYTTKLPVALHRHAWDREERSRFIRPLDGLLADPGLLDDEIWRLFTVPGAATFLGAWDDGLWEDALATLSERGRLDRGRLLDACLDAFTRDFPPNQVGWYVTFHDRMNPSLDEMATRADRYLALLASGSKPGVSLGQQACGRLLDAGRLPAEDFLAASGPALLFPRKNVATAQLKLIGKIAAGQPSARGPALAAAARAFGHQRLDVQEAALGLIARYGRPEGPERLAISELAASLAPGLAPEAEALGLLPSPAGRHVEILPPPPSEPEAGKPLAPPLDDPGELIQLLTQLMEDASDTLAVERALAGAVRLCALPAAERARLAAPLLKRAGKRVREDYDGPLSGHQIASDIAALTLAWGSDWSPDIAGARRVWGSEDRETVLRSGQAKTMAGILTARIWEACALAAGGRPVQLLAEPESDRGAISPEGLLDRLASWTAGSPPRHDLEVALLRLTPGVDEVFWSAWAQVHPSSVRAARRAYSQGLAPLSFEPEVGLPDHRGFASPGDPDPLVLARITGAPADRAGSHCWALLTALSRPLRDFYQQYGERWYVGPGYQALVAGWPLLCPWQPELAAAHLLRPLSESLRPGSTWAGTAATAARGLSGAGRPLGEIGHLALLTGLASAEPYVRIATAEVWAEAARDGRLDPGLAARAIVTGVTGRAFKLNRVADGLQHASHEPAAGRQIAETAFAAADDLIPAKPANLYLLFELVTKMGAAAFRPEPPGAITRLAAQKNSSRLVAAARHLTPRAH